VYFLREIGEHELADLLLFVFVFLALCGCVHASLRLCLRIWSAGAARVGLGACAWARVFGVVSSTHLMAVQAASTSCSKQLPCKTMLLKRTKGTKKYNYFTLFCKCFFTFSYVFQMSHEKTQCSKTLSNQQVKQ
jgi:hypothetical protein